MPDRNRSSASGARERAVDSRKSDASGAAPSLLTGSELTAEGTPTMETPGYGTSQGASGATSGGADPGGAVKIPQP